ncbi:S-layer homology domain-containing protein [Desulfuribacillus alkaliarsenatis]|uniref:SLH domain-containing protein n=1 Tax=Desulfuribacillus alkaliarsenatis TaxID=766136 RepID=A0A1E5G532_9FIRM|nr:S-layer homology domain-containing protein [Desulfuribacillus alkaliarsenatis]OEF98281.1 hypothetical protein BHF68_00945 [Desulfuribacillus alkaliarsenatis]
MKKISLLAVLLLILVFSSQAVAYGSESTTLQKYYPIDYSDHWAYAELDDFINADLLEGYINAIGDIEIRPNNHITRAEFAALLVRALQVEDNQQGKTFKDVSNTESWYYNIAKVASGNGIATGTDDGYFLPNERISREAIATMIARAFADSIDFNAGDVKHFADTPSIWAVESVAKVSKADIIKGYNTEAGAMKEFRPQANATRAEAVTMLHRALHLQQSQLPEKNELTKLIESFYNEYFGAIANADSTQLLSISEQYTTGFQRHAADIEADFIDYIIDAGGTYIIDNVIEGNIASVYLRNKFAVIEIENFVYEIEIIQADSSTSKQKDVSGTYYMKEMSNGSWKIYYIKYNNIFG